MHCDKVVFSGEATVELSGVIVFYSAIETFSEVSCSPSSVGRSLYCAIRVFHMCLQLVCGGMPMHVVVARHYVQSPVLLLPPLCSERADPGRGKPSSLEYLLVDLVFTP